MKAGRRTIAAAVLALGCLLRPVEAKPEQANPGVEAAKLLDESYANSANLDATERALYLERLTRIAAEISHEKTETWCDELLRLAPHLESAWSRVNAQKNALMALARVNPRRAMQLLSGLEAAEDYPFGPPPEDLRADAAIVVFHFYRQAEPLSLPKIEDEARRIGDSGEYPYHAMAAIILDLSRSQKDDAKQEVEKILRDALASYQKPSIYTDVNEEFLRLLESAEFGDHPTIYGEALHAFVKRLQGDADKVVPSFSGRIDTAKGTYRFPNQNRLLLFRALPLLARFSPSWADELKNQYPELKNAGGEIQNIEQGRLEGTATPDQAAQLQKRVDERAALAQITYLQQVNPWAALDLAQKLPTTGGRILGLAAILPTMSQVDAVQANNIYLQQVDDASGIDDDNSNLAVTVALAKSAYYLRDTNGFSGYVAKAFDVGARVFQQDEKTNQKKHIFERPGYIQLGELAEFCAQHNATWVVQDIRELQSNGLKAYLLASAGKGASRQASIAVKNPAEDSPETAKESHKIPNK